MEKEILQNLLRSHGLRPNFTYGQNFLTDESVLDEMVLRAKVEKNDRVLEIGAGIGNLTEKLCERAGQVLSLEKDPKFLPILKGLSKDKNNLRFEITDALEYDFQKYFSENEAPGLKSSYKVVANIPYFVTGKIIQMLMVARKKPESVTLLVQKEVAERVAAQPGEMSVLAISVQIFGHASVLRKVAAESFYPAPKVDSAILQIDLYPEPKFEIQNEKKFFSLVKACFAGKRKQLRNTLSSFIHGTKIEADSLLEKSGIDPSVRPQDLRIEDWVSLYKNYFNE